MTRQIQDKLIYNNEEHYLNDELLEYRIREHPHLATKVSGGFTACWRGYVATYEIKNFELLLKEVSLIHSEEENEKDIFLNGLFNDLKKQKLTWLNCIIVLYKNKIIGEFNIPELNSYEEYELLEIKNGNLTDFKILSQDEYRQFKEEQYACFINSEDYEICKNKFIDSNVKYNEHEKTYLSKSKWKQFIFNEGNFKEMVKDDILYYTKKFYQANFKNDHH